MCGITAMLTLQGHLPLNHEIKGGLSISLNESLDMIKHRGPDSRGQWISPDSRVGPLTLFPPPKCKDASGNELIQCYSTRTCTSRNQRLKPDGQSAIA